MSVRPYDRWYKGVTRRSGRAAGAVPDSVRRKAAHIVFCYRPGSAMVAPVYRSGPMSQAICLNCLWFVEGFRDHEGVLKKMPRRNDRPARGRCHIRSSPDAFPTRWSDDHCGEYRPAIPADGEPGA